MKKKPVYLGENEINKSKKAISGQFIEIEGELYYQIKNYHEMPDFFMSIVSDSDHWMFISSNGSLTAGRKDRDNALFPYYTDDKIHDYRDRTGGKSFFLIEKEGKTYLWEPFTEMTKIIYRIERNIYKNIVGNKIIFEERNKDLELQFRYGWSNSKRFGFIKKSSLTNLSQTTEHIEILDGIRNILPFGVDYAFQNEYSNLLDAYKKSERVENTSLGLFTLSSIPVDRAEPSESLKATAVWSLGPDEKNRILISDHQINKFKNALQLEDEYDIRAGRGSYFINSSLKLNANDSKSWITIADINQESTDVANLIKFINEEKKISQIIQKSIEDGTYNLERKVGMADGIQQTNDELSAARHFSNTMFNIMRGGIYSRGYNIERRDFINFSHNVNKPLFNEFESWFDKLPEKIFYPDLILLAEETENSNLIRITQEYLPLTFSRRHGDPSRPWNHFSIETKNPDGSEKLNYEGNWRDIFQNWEALNGAFPEYIESIISKFLNASTADGYNPYRITRDGLDWEKPDPGDPWAYIGYWGDHQIIYLQKFLEQSHAFHPGKLEQLLSDEIFVYANVPYRIKEYDELVRNPQDTILFDHKLNEFIEKQVNKIGSDGQLLANSSGKLYHVNLTEKILVTTLAKLTNFIPEAGIWLNTQRPEWNDANNALVGNGTSMVTLYYLRRFLKFWDRLFGDMDNTEFQVSEEVNVLFTEVGELFLKSSDILQKGFNDAERRDFLNQLGKAGSVYRQKIYNNSFSGKKVNISPEQLKEFTSFTLKFIDQSIEANKRKDELYHAYNIITFARNDISIRNLYEMLEGQVAVLSSGYLSPKESLRLMDSLKSSKLFRADQYSYLLYPDRQLPRFVEKNNIPAGYVKHSELLNKLLKSNDSSIIQKDLSGNYHFNGLFRNKDMLIHALDDLEAKKYAKLVEKEKEKILEIYEELFDHKSFTGRSGTFYGYEGLGSIYWHMVSKLLLAVQECYFHAMEEGADSEITGRIKEHYYEIKAGIGLYKSPELYGAFPTDAYSHTPAAAGAKQPGLTGQVKEDVLSRMAELGIHIRNGEIVFKPSLLNEKEYLEGTGIFAFIDQDGKEAKIDLKQGQLAFTFCQVPVIYSQKQKQEVIIEFENGEKINYPGNSINKKISSSIFNRSGMVRKIEFYTSPGQVN